MPLPLVWLDGRLLPLAEARISPLDRGFLFGDGVYEVLPVYGGRAYRLDAHLERLDRSLREIRMAPVLDRSRLARGLRPAGARQRRRRPAPVRAGHARRRTRAQPRAAAGHAPDGIRLRRAAAGDVRRVRIEHGTQCDHRGGPALGALRHQDHFAARQRAAALAGARTPARRRPILLRDGWLTEGSTSSVHVVKGGRLADAAADQRDPAGHDPRAYLFELAARAGIASERRPVRRDGTAQRRRDPHRLRRRRHPRRDDARRPAGRATAGRAACSGASTTASWRRCRSSRPTLPA